MTNLIKYLVVKKSVIGIGHEK